MILSLIVIFISIIAILFNPRPNFFLFSLFIVEILFVSTIIFLFYFSFDFDDSFPLSFSLFILSFSAADAAIFISFLLF